MKVSSKPAHKLYDVAETLFVEKGMTCAAISEDLKIRETTLSGWRAKMQWDTARQQFLTTPGAIRKLLLAELEFVAGGNKSRIDTDSLSKIAKTLTYFDGKIALPVIVTVFKDYDNWIAETHPHEAIKEMGYHKEYLHHLAKLESYK
jgi:hypothetical protein